MNINKKTSSKTNGLNVVNSLTILSVLMKCLIEYGILMIKT